MKTNRRESSFLDGLCPESIEELASWDQRHVKALNPRPFGAQLMIKLRRAMFVATDFSGFDAPRECCQAMSAACEHEFEVKPRFNFARASDWGDEQQRPLTLRSHKCNEGAICVFGDILDRLQPDHRDWIKSASPTKEMSLADAQMANHLVAQFASSNEITQAAATSYCAMRRQRCPVHIRPALQGMSSAQSRTLTAADDDEALVLSPRRKRQRMFVSGVPWYERLLEKFCSSADVADAIVFNVAGLVCTDYTPLGKRRGSHGGVV